MEPGISIFRVMTRSAPIEETKNEAVVLWTGSQDVVLVSGPNCNLILVSAQPTDLLGV